MSKNKRRSKDPHSWIKDTTKPAAEPEPSERPESEAAAVAAEATPAGPEEAAEPEAEEVEEVEEDESVPRRYVVVEYDTSDGRIIAMHDATEEDQERGGGLQVLAAEGKAATRIALTGEMLDKTLLDIHDNHKVDTSKKKKPALVPKS